MTDRRLEIAVEVALGLMAGLVVHLVPRDLLPVLATVGVLLGSVAVLLTWGRR